MIPLRDNVPSTISPTVNRLLIVTSVVAFLLTYLQPARFEAILFTYGMVPSEVTRGAPVGAPFPTYLTLVTTLFLHGSWLHLGGNMLYLWIFGDNVEDAMGHVPYLVFYLLCGIAANLAQLWVNPAFSGPVIGASGAIAGVLGGYLVLYPRARVLALVPLGFFLTTTEIPALLFLPIWFLFQLVAGAAAGVGQEGGVAYWAHVGGFVVGFLVVRLFAARRRDAVWR